LEESEEGPGLAKEGEEDDVSLRSDDGDGDQSEMSTVERFLEANRRRFQREMQKSLGTHASTVVGHFGRAGWSVLVATGWAYRQGRAASRRLEREADDEEQAGLAAKGLAEHTIEEVRRMDTGSGSGQGDPETTEESESSPGNSETSSKDISRGGESSGEMGDGDSFEEPSEDGGNQEPPEDEGDSEGSGRKGPDRGRPEREGPESEENGTEPTGSDGE
jgi:hypothetical protein